MKKILLVDDDQLVRLCISAGLEAHLEGCCIVTARNGREAASILSSNPVDVVLTDLNMPEMDGYELAEHVGNNYPGAVVFTMSGNLMEDEKGTARRLPGCVVKCFRKPLDLKSLSIEIGNAISNRSVPGSPGTLK